MNNCKQVHISIFWNFLIHILSGDLLISTTVKYEIILASFIKSCTEEEADFQNIPLMQSYSRFYEDVAIICNDAIICFM